MAKIYYFLKMWHGSQNQYAIQMKSCTQNNYRTAIGYISDTKEIVKASWSNVQHHTVASFTLLDSSPLPPAVFAMDLPGRQTQVLNVCNMKTLNWHPAECDENSALDSIVDKQYWLNWNPAQDNPNISKDNWEVDNKIII